jgi:hypothetical protein
MMDGFEKPQPAGRYVIDTTEEMLDTLSFPVWKRVSTSIRLGNFGAIEHTAIDPEDLATAIARDAVDEETPQTTPAKKSGADSARAMRSMQRKQF